MVQFNKNIISNTKIKNNILYGGNDILNTIYSSNMLILITLIICVIFMYITITTFWKLKLNGIFFLVVFGYIIYYLYNTLIYHTTKLGISLTTTRKRKRGAIIKLMDDIVNVIYLIPNLIPIIPKIQDPKFNISPFTDIRNGIRSLQYPYKFNGDNYKLKLNFPVVKIPFIDPLAGICCVWEQLKKLVKIIEKAIEGPKKLIENIFKGIKIAINTIIKYTVNPIIDAINGIVTAAASPIIGILLGVVGFLKGIGTVLPIDGVKNAIKDIMKVVNNLQNPIKGKPKIGGKNTYKKNKFKRYIYNKLNKKHINKGGNNKDYEKNDINDYIINYNGPNIYDTFYKIDILREECDYKNKICKKKLKNMSIFKMYNIENNKKNGVIDYVNNYKKKKFSIYCKEEFKKRKHQDYLDRINPNKPNPSHFIYYDSKKHGYNIESQINKTKNTQYNKINMHGGGIGDWMKKIDEATKIIDKIMDIFKNLPDRINIVCIVVKLVTNAIRKVGRQIDNVAKSIFGPIPGFIKKIGQLIIYVGAIIEWVLKILFNKIIRFIEAAVEFVFSLSLGNLPAGIGPGIMKGIKVIFNILLLILELPFLDFLTTIVETLTDIPKFFNTIAHIMDKICQIMESVIKPPLQALWNNMKIAIVVAEKAIAAIKWAAEMAKRAMNAISKSGGGANKVDKIIYKHNYELYFMIKKRDELINTNKHIDNYVDKYYLIELNKLIENKKKYIKKLTYNKKKYIKYNSKHI